MYRLAGAHLVRELSPRMNVPYNSPREELLPFLSTSARRVLDVGCGGGGFGRTVLERRPEVEIWGVEPHAPSAAVARSSGYVHVESGSFPDVAPRFSDGMFDAILFNDVLEHIVEPAAALRAARRLLAREGRVVASIPNVRHFSVWWPLIRHGEWRYTDSGLLDRTHVRFFTRDTMRALFNECGFVVESMTGVNRSRWPDSGIDTWKTRWLSRLTLGRSDDFFFVQYVVVARAAL